MSPVDAISQAQLDNEMLHPELYSVDHLDAAHRMHSVVVEALGRFANGGGSLCQGLRAAFEHVACCSSNSGILVFLAPDAVLRHAAACRVM